jgi:hypothetical protein
MGAPAMELLNALSHASASGTVVRDFVRCLRELSVSRIAGQWSHVRTPA